MNVYQVCTVKIQATKFGKLFLRKVIKTVATRCLDFSSKRPKMRLTAGLCPDLLGELKRSPRPPSRKKGPTSTGRGRERREGMAGREGRGRKGGEGFRRTNQNTAATALLSQTIGDSIQILDVILPSINVEKFMMKNGTAE